MNFKFSAVNIINVLGIFVIFYLLVLLYGVIERNYRLDNSISTAREEVALLVAGRDQLRDQTAYYKTDAFLERLTRSKLGLRAQGEFVVALPSPVPTSTPRPQEKAVSKNNLALWLDFLRGVKSQ